MYTLPEYRGQGINGRIIADLKRWAVSRGLTEIRLTVYYGFKRHLVEMRLREGEG